MPPSGIRCIPLRHSEHVNKNPHRHYSLGPRTRLTISVPRNISLPSLKQVSYTGCLFVSVLCVVFGFGTKHVGLWSKIGFRIESVEAVLKSEVGQFRFPEHFSLCQRIQPAIPFGCSHKKNETRLLFNFLSKASSSCLLPQHQPP